MACLPRFRLRPSALPSSLSHGRTCTALYANSTRCSGSTCVLPHWLRIAHASYVSDEFAFFAILCYNCPTLPRIHPQQWSPSEAAFFVPGCRVSLALSASRNLTPDAVLGLPCHVLRKQMQILNEIVTARMPNGTRKLVAEAASRQGIHASHYFRNAVIRQLVADGLPLPGRLACHCPQVRKQP